jgi:hypothetical protein
MAEIEHIESLAARVAGAGIGEFAPQDCVATVREQQGADVEPSPACVHNACKVYMPLP